MCATSTDPAVYKKLEILDIYFLLDFLRYCFVKLFQSEDNLLKALLIKHINILDATETITEFEIVEARSPRRRTPSPTKTTLIISSPINQHSQNSIGLSPTKIELSTDVKDEIIGIHGEFNC